MATVRVLAGSIEALHHYWLGLAGGAVPQRSDVDPTAIKSLLPYLYIVKFETGPFRVRYMLVGTEADRWNDLSLTGRYLNEFLPVDRNSANHTLLACYQRAFETGAPVFGSYTWPTRAGYTLEVRFGMFPLRVGERIKQCLAIEDYSDFPPEIADDGIPTQDPVKIGLSSK
jgi:hypothetical protein